jgi:Zn-dependent peptidase ImmA (M78 family)
LFSNGLHQRLSQKHSPKDPAGRYALDEIEEIALSVRKHWGLGLGPLSNVLALLESKGIVLCHYELEGESVEAFSFWNGSRPFIFMASEKEAGVRRRYDLAHELGHLGRILINRQPNADLCRPMSVIGGKADMART